jgi:hypothetical protein
MLRKSRPFHLVIGILALMALAYLSSISCRQNGPVVVTSGNYYEIPFDETGEKVYIRARSWGLVGNHQEIIIAASPINNRHLEYFPETQFIFLDSSDLYYKKLNADTLLVYADSVSNTPPHFSSRVRVKQVELIKDEIGEYAAKYKEYGLTRVDTLPIHDPE